MDEVEVSVCITAYNVESYISQAIDGALMQKTSFVFEIVIGDDGSIDGTRQILLSYKEKYPDIIQLILHDKNIGVAKNDISVVKKARGKYLAWCDGDDYWIDENKLQKQYEILEKNPDISLVHTDWMNYYEDKKSFNDVRITPNELERKSYGISNIEMLLLKENSGCRFSSCMFRKEYYLGTLSKNSDLFLCGHFCNDFAVFISMYEHGRFFHIPIVTTVYRIRTESLSMTQNNKKRYRYLKEYYSLIVQIISYYKIINEVSNCVYKKLLNELFKYTFFNQRKEEAISLKKIADNSNYRLSLAQLVLYYGSLYPILNCLLKPILNIIIKK